MTAMWNGTGMPKMGKMIVSYFLSGNLIVLLILLNETIFEEIPETFLGYSQSHATFKHKFTILNPIKVQKTKVFVVE